MHIPIGLPSLPATLCYHVYAYGVSPGNEQNNDGQTYWGEQMETIQVSRYHVCYHGYAYGVAPDNEQNNDGQTCWGELVEATVASRYPVCYHGFSGPQKTFAAIKDS